VKIVILVEGDTEDAFKQILVAFLRARLGARMPRLKFQRQDGRIPTHDKLKRMVQNHFSGKEPADAVIALTDLYTGTGEFKTAEDAKRKMRAWVGIEETRFYPHVAQHDFEAWLLPYWPDIQKLAKHNKAAPGSNPEQVNHTRPPAHHLKELFEIGRARDSYIKPRDARRILEGRDLLVSINQCSELKSFVNTILTLCGGEPIP
jgi:hypothetical protein